MIEKFLLGNIKGPQGLQGPQGVPGQQGKPLTYDDLTEAQIDSFAQKSAAIVLEVANICYVSSSIPTADTGKDGDICVVKG